MIIAIDFDGTIAKTDYPAILEPMPGVVEGMTALKKERHFLIVWTCRTGDELLDAINWMLQHGIPFDRVNDHSLECIAKYGGDGKKINADVYIDDRNLGGFPGWEVAVQEVLRFSSLETWP